MQVSAVLFTLPISVNAPESIQFYKPRNPTPSSYVLEANTKSDWVQLINVHGTSPFLCLST